MQVQAHNKNFFTPSVRLSFKNKQYFVTATIPLDNICHKIISGCGTKKSEIISHGYVRRNEEYWVVLSKLPTSRSHLRAPWICSLYVRIITMPQNKQWSAMPISLCYLHWPHYCRGQMLSTTPVYLSSENIAAQGVFVSAKVSQSSSTL